MDAAVRERRRDVRYGRESVVGMRGRVRPGHDIVIVDVSASGALVEVMRPLRPGARVYVQLTASASEAAVVARVTRCAVAAVSEARITYRAALQFDRHCDWVRESVTRHGYDLHDEASIESVEGGTALPARFEPLPAEPFK